MQREEILERVISREPPWDIIVIGGGATGVGCAVDAASRGYDVLLLEQHDFGKGTSSRSTKLIHGGVRYLAQGNLSLVREALKERAVLLRNAAHVVRRQSFIVPCYTTWQKLYYGIGLKLYDLLASGSGIGRSTILSSAAVLSRLENIRTAGLAGGISYVDGQFDDARLLIDLVKTADAEGAAVLNYARVKSLIKDEEGMNTGVVFEDVESGLHHTSASRIVINASGVFCDDIRRLSDADSKRLLSLSQGVHLVFDRKFLPGDDAVLIPKTSDGRVFFCIPWHGQMLAGTTDTRVSRAALEPEAREAEIDFVLQTAGEFLNDRPERSDIVSIFAGIRPLVRSDTGKKTALLSREHLIEVDHANLLTITGGKWTTYRRMAEDAVNLAAEKAGLPKRKSMTRKLPIHGNCSDPSKFGDLAVYGTDAAEIQRIIESNAKLAEKLHPELPYSKAEIVWNVKNEMARNLEDVLARRTRALFINAWAATDIAPVAAEIIAAELGKNDDWVKKQVKQFTTLARSYLPK